jgi:zinc transport system ATP-binding protein
MTHDCPQCEAAAAHKGHAIIEAKNAWVSFGQASVLRGVNLRIPKGEIVALIGPNGSGKTTLLRALLGLQKLDRGDVRLFGEPLSSRTLGRVGYVPQKLNLERTFSLSVREFMALRLKATRHWFWQSHTTIEARLRPLLVEIGVEPLLDLPVAKLSGGQLQRVLIAFSLLHEPELLLLDEPTAGVDTPGEQTFYELIANIHKRHRLTVVLVSHDLSMVFRHASWVYALNGVICCEGTPAEVMNAESLKQAYGIYVSPYHHHHHGHGHP